MEQNWLIVEATPPIQVSESAEAFSSLSTVRACIRQEVLKFKGKQLIERLAVDVNLDVHPIILVLAKRI